MAQAHVGAAREGESQDVEAGGLPGLVAAFALLHEAMEAALAHGTALLGLYGDGPRLLMVCGSRGHPVAYRHKDEGAVGVYGLSLIHI